MLECKDELQKRIVKKKLAIMVQKMIRRIEIRDLDEVMSLWLYANIESHSFKELEQNCFILL